MELVKLIGVSTKKRTWLRLGQVFLAMVMAVMAMTPVPALAAIDSPDNLDITWGGAYRNYMELDDQLYIFAFTIDYTVNPTEGTAADLFIARLMNGAATLGSTSPYAYYDEGYDYGIGAMYFTAQEVTDLAMGWGAGTGYTIKLQGNPLLSWTDSPPPNITLGSLNTWYDDGTVLATQSALTTRLRVLAQAAENAWNPGVLDIIETLAGVAVLTPQGEDYFQNTIVYVREACPDLFGTAMTTPDYDESVVVNDYYNLSDDTGVTIYGVNWYAQTWTATTSYDISGLWMKLYRVGNPGVVTVAVRATAANLPTGADLANGAFSSTDITTTNTGDWYQVNFTDDVTITAGTVYSLVVRATAGDAANYIAWRTDTGNGYAGGRACSSANNGAAWSGVAANDTMFINTGFGAVTMSFALQREGFLLGTPFDFTALANMVGASRMLIGGLIWYALSLLTAFVITRKANSYKPVLMVVAIMSPFGGYFGFMNFYVSLLIAAVIGLGAIYAIAWSKAP